MNSIVPESTELNFSELEKHLLNDFQHDLPLTENPFADIARKLGSNEETVINTLKSLKDRGIISRVGPVFRANRIGVSTLAAMAVPEKELVQVAERVSAYAEVNHNYERLHQFNLWFVVTARDDSHLERVLLEMEKNCGYAVMSLPMLEDYFIDLGFDLKWT